jgi:hypothetical protein
MPPLAIPLMTCCRKLCAAAFDCETSHLEHVGLSRHLERDSRVLLDEQDRDAIRLVNGADDLEDRAHDHRRKTERRFVEEHERRLHEQCASDREHLLLPAGERAGG